MAWAKTIKVGPIISQDRDRQHDKLSYFTMYGLVQNQDMLLLIHIRWTSKTMWMFMIKLFSSVYYPIQ